MRCDARGVLLSLLVCCLAIGVDSRSLVAQDAAATAAGQGDKTPEPQFKSEKYQKYFEEGRAHFDEEDFKAAAKSFKSASRGAKTKEDKKLVTGWADACKGASVLVQAQKLQKKNYINEAYDLVLVALRKYKGTPIEPAFTKLYGELERLLFQVIESFDRRSPKFSKKFGKTFISDQRLQANGTMCLHWQNTRDGKPGMLKIAPVPRNWSQYVALEFWVHCRVPAKGDVLLVADPAPKKGQKAPAKTRRGENVVSLPRHSLVLPRKGGWQYIRLKLPSFQAQGNADLAQVKEFRIQFSGTQSFDFFLDEIRLRRRNPTPAKEAGSPGTRRK